MTQECWSQSLHGKAIDLVHPREDQVDFEEIAWTLAGINRYAGASEKTISVAQHTLIAIEIADPHVRPYVALHDAHEARIGDITTPVATALELTANEVAEPLRSNDMTAALIVRDALRTLKQRHDEVIYRAAGLTPPNYRPELLLAIKEADLRALMTERRDFLCSPPKPWDIDRRSIAPARRVYRMISRQDAALQLFDVFKQLLPVFQIKSKVKS